MLDTYKYLTNVLDHLPITPQIHIPAIPHDGLHAHVRLDTVDEIELT